MAGLQDYAKIPIVVDGIYQSQISNVSVTAESGNQRVDTLDGLAGFTPGAGSVEISASWALPIGGMEFDVLSAIANRTLHQLQIPVGNKTVVTSGKFMNGGVSGSVGSASEVTASFTGTLNPPE